MEREKDICVQGKRNNFGGGGGGQIGAVNRQNRKSHITKERAGGVAGEAVAVVEGKVLGMK